MPSADRSPVLTGGCQCGAIRYAIYEMPTEGYVCHCRMCQKAVGGPFLTVAPVALTHFAWTRGEPKTYASSSIAERDFCGDCGTPLTYRGTAGTRVNVALGSLDDPGARPPTLQYDVDARIPWIDDLDKMTRHHDAGLKPEVVARMVNYQHPDRETGEDWQPPRHPGGSKT